MFPNVTLGQEGMGMKKLRVLVVISQSLAGLWQQSAPFTGGEKPLSHVFLMLLLDQSWLTVTLSHSHIPRVTVHQDMSSQPGIADYCRKSSSWPRILDK